MKFASILVIAFLLLLFQFSYKQQTYDHMEFVMSWVPTFCAQANVHCKSPMPEVFTLHGLWPGDDRGETLQCTDTNPGRDLTALFKRLSPHLEKAWPSVTNLDAKKLWSLEYSKHGCCAEPTVNTFLYFTAAIQKRKDINLLEFLKDASIVPSDDLVYKENDIIKAVKDAIDSNFQIYISCKKMNMTHTSLHEVYICLDRTLTSIVSCPINNRPRGCSGNLKIVIPTAKP